MLHGVYQFVEWQPISEDLIKRSRPYELLEKLEKGEKLNREEKDYITMKVNEGVYYNNAVALGGWCINFAKYLKRYVVKQYDQWTEKYAMDKTSLRKNLYGYVDEIVELPS